MTYIQLAAAGAVANVLLGLGRMSPMNLTLGLLLGAAVAWVYRSEGTVDHEAQARDRAKRRRKSGVGS